jgi:hypothetical protein
MAGSELFNRRAVSERLPAPTILMKRRKSLISSIMAEHPPNRAVNYMPRRRTAKSHDSSSFHLGKGCDPIPPATVVSVDGYLGKRAKHRPIAYPADRTET